MYQEGNVQTYLEQFHQTGNIAGLDVSELGLASLVLGKTALDAKSVVLSSRNVSEYKASECDAAHLEAPGFPLKFPITLHVVCHLVKVLFHLNAEAVIETGEVCEACDSKVEMQHVVFVLREDFSEQSSLWSKLRMHTCDIFQHTFPTELAPKRMVKEGSVSSARSITAISCLRGKNPGSRENVCRVRIWERSRCSEISRRASSSNRLDSVRDRTVSAG